MINNLNYCPLQGLVALSDAYQTCVAPAPVNRWVQCFWQLNVPVGNYSYRSLPDNCVDVIINLQCPDECFVIAPYASAIVFDMVGPVSYFGIRFRLLGHQGLIATPLGEWPESALGIEAAQLLPETVLAPVRETCALPLSFAERCHALANRLVETIQLADIDPRLVRFLHYCQRNLTAGLSLSDAQCADFGVSARQLRRLSQLYLGASPKAFVRVMRFQHMLRGLRSAHETALWASCYYDQPHFIREFKRLSGLTPGEFCTVSVLYNRN